MVRHIVSWNFKPELTPQQREEAGRALVAAGTGLMGKIDCLHHIEMHAPPTGLSNCDVALYAEILREEDLVTYRDHPEHQKVGVLTAQWCCDRRCVDVLV